MEVLSRVEVSMLEFVIMSSSPSSGVPMFELPLFPLNTVLFPGMPLHLHIFEERYKKMIQFCLERSVPFGVVLIRQGVEAYGPIAEPYPVGCTARIIEMEPLSEGRMNIVAVGQERFRTVLLDSRKAAFLTGIVQPFPLSNSNSGALENAGQRLKPWVKRYLEVLAKSENVKMEVPDIPDDPETLAYLAAISLQVPNKDKQDFLSEESTTDLLEKLLATYRREIALLRAAMASRPDSVANFSKN